MAEKEDFSDFMELAERRYSVRKFEDRPVERTVLEQIVRAGYVAPTACNLQPQRILVIDGAEALMKLRRCTKCHFNAPAAMLVCYDKTVCWKREYDGKLSGDVDASIVTTHMMLEAESLGVGATWVMYFIPEAVRVEFDMPESYEPTALLLLGYPAADAKPGPLHAAFQPLSNLVFYNEFPKK